jgi:hypothetical protein
LKGLPDEHVVLAQAFSTDEKQHAFLARGMFNFLFTELLTRNNIIEPVDQLNYLDIFHEVWRIVTSHTGVPLAAEIGHKPEHVTPQTAVSRGMWVAFLIAMSVMLAMAGVIPGIALAYVAGRSMEALLAGVKPADAPTMIAAVGLSVLMTLVGSVMPTLRALRVDPITALRAE